MSRKEQIRLQSAMEYLMTYGWAILIIAVVLGVLFQLGVFNSANFAPRAPPGSCKVLRPGGPGTNSNLNLVGVCSGELPQYVASFGNWASVVISNNANQNSNSITVSFWLNLAAYSPVGDYGQLVSKGINTAYFAYMAPSATYPQWSAMTTTPAQQWANWPAPPLNTWHYYVGTYSSATGYLTTYYDGVGSSPLSLGGNLITSATSLHIGGGTPTIGQMANVQVYNISLSASDVQTLYLKGIGGAPIYPQYLVGWWPLNGNATDYSGNNNSGAPTGVVYSSQWLSGYTTP